MRCADQPDGAGWRAFDEREAVAIDAQASSLGKHEVAGLAFKREPHPPFGAFETDTACAL